MENDYRNTLYCPKLKDINKKKNALNEEITQEHPRAKIIYNQIKDNDNKYKMKFVKIYNYKCSYCGNAIDHISSNLLEVDHYICESSFDSKEVAGKIENLVLACYDCNRAKSNFLIENKYIDILNPDLEIIKDVFLRDEMYSIQISEEYKNDKFIKSFYDKIKLEYQSRRLDFLLINILGMCEKFKGKPHAEKLNTILIKLQQKRNLTSCKTI
ncbi:MULTISPECIES: HNH endonuclease [Clostridium]|uniref:HNH endonuclease n=1 Tax=Clostridium frigoriphilum TaxID=443253 RepID=A0ABU7UJG0_9CLOT|nr:HNH endonuclease [Clostridium sp. DSM 17811]MBU3098075.1 HNH endonuclease [Clostridium sp. DSM 17811]